jgi:hypothetical protein
MNLMKSAVLFVTKEHWAGYSKHVQMLEQQYWEKDGQLPDVIGNIIILCGATESTCSESSINSSSSDGDLDSDLTGTSDLAQSLAE